MKSLKSSITKAACMLAFACTANSFDITHAQVSPQYIVSNEPASNIHFVGMEGEMLVFELRLNTLLPKGSMLRISDEENNILFEERTGAATYNIRYKILRNDLSKINFEISSKSFLLNQSFNVSTKTEEKTEVTKV